MADVALLPRTLMTRREYYALGEPPPGLWFELLDGELIVMNAPGALHQLVVRNLLVALQTWCHAGSDRGAMWLPLDADIADDTVLIPDLQWFAADGRLPLDGTAPHPVGDLVIEVASPSTRRYDREIKARRYLAAGAREVWLVDPRPLRVEVLTATRRRGLTAGEEIASPLLPGLALPVASLLDGS